MLEKLMKKTPGNKLLHKLEHLIFMSSKASTRKRTRTESETEPLSPLSERDLPTSASSFLLKHTLALGIKFTTDNDLYDFLPNVPIDGKIIISEKLVFCAFPFASVE